MDKRAQWQLEIKAGELRINTRGTDGRRTMDEVFDDQTLMTIYDLMTNEVFDILDFPISTGKEGNVFRANLHAGGHVAVKIFRTSNATFNSIQRYIIGDPRFRGLHGNRRKLIYAWAQKEYKNLARLREHKIRCPEPLVCRKNVLVMGYLGTAARPAPSLREAPPDRPADFLDDLLEQVRTMVTKASLVHCDLSEYNILIHRRKGYIIDLGQAVTSDHPNAPEYLLKDIANVLRFFSKLGVDRDLGETVRYVRGGA
jgi:RIO kinase 1